MPVAEWIGYDIAGAVLTPTITAGAYSAGACVGTLMTIALQPGTPVPVTSEGNSGEVKTALLYDKASQIGTHQIDAILFHDNPAASTFVDGSAYTLHDDDLTKQMVILAFTAASGAELSVSTANHTMQLRNVGGVYEASISTISVQLVARGTPTFGSSSDLSLRLQLRRD